MDSDNRPTQHDTVVYQKLKQLSHIGTLSKTLKQLRDGVEFLRDTYSRRLIVCRKVCRRVSMTFNNRGKHDARVVNEKHEPTNKPLVYK
jgi:hypothetical protein